MIAYRSDRFVGWEDVYPMYWGIMDMKVVSNVKPASINVKVPE
jgi:hypothetical protein